MLEQIATPTTGSGRWRRRADVDVDALLDVLSRPFGSSNGWSRSSERCTIQPSDRRVGTVAGGTIATARRTTPPSSVSGAESFPSRRPRRSVAA